MEFNKTFTSAHLSDILANVNSLNNSGVCSDIVSINIVSIDPGDEPFYSTLYRADVVYQLLEGAHVLIENELFEIVEIWHDLVSLRSSKGRRVEYTEEELGAILDPAPAYTIPGTDGALDITGQVVVIPVDGEMAEVKAPAVAELVAGTPELTEKQIKAALYGEMAPAEARPIIAEATKAGYLTKGENGQPVRFTNKGRAWAEAQANPAPAVVVSASPVKRPTFTERLMAEAAAPDEKRAKLTQEERLAVIKLYVAFKETLLLSLPQETQDKHFNELCLFCQDHNLNMPATVTALEALNFLPVMPF